MLETLRSRLPFLPPFLPPFRAVVASMGTMPRGTMPTGAGVGSGAIDIPGACTAGGGAAEDKKHNVQ